MPSGAKPGERRGGRKPGTPNKTTAGLKAFAGQFTEECIVGLLAIARSTEAPPAARVAAYKEVLDRGVGRAPQALTGEDGGPIAIKQVVDVHEPGTV